MNHPAAPVLPVVPAPVQAVYVPVDRPEHDADRLAEQLRFWRRSISKHKWSALGLAAAISLLTTLIVFVIQPTYRSTATLMLESNKSKVVSIEEVYSSMSSNREYYQTQAEILKSEELARRVVDKMKLVDHPALDPRQQQDSGLSFRKLLPASWLGEDDAERFSPAKVQAAVIARFKQGLTIELVRNSQLIKISYESHDKEFAANAANWFADGFIEADMDARLAMTQKAGAWLTERLTGLRKKLEESERNLQQFRERERIIDAKGVAQSGASKQLEQLAGGLVAARQKKAEAEAAYLQVQSAQKSNIDIESIPAIQKSTIYIDLKRVESAAESRLADAAKRYGPDHPKRQSADAEYRAARENTRKQVDTIVTSITKEYELARAQETSVERALAQSKGDILGMNRKEYELGILEREVASNKNLYEMFTNRMKETNVAGDLQSPIARVVDPAVVGSSAYSPKKFRIIGIAAVVGLILGIMLALLLEYLDNTIKSAEDVDIKLRESLLGQLPRIKGKIESGDLQIAFIKDKDPGFSEAIRSIRTGVMLSAIDAPHKVLLVTSSIPGEGKTSVATNMALALGQVRKVCLIDADMRRPTVAKVLGVDTSSKGLSNLVSGSDPTSECLHFNKELGIHIIPSGVVPPNPLELLSSVRFAEAMKWLEESFDVIIIDSPPLQLVSDPLILSQFAHSVVYVVKADATPYQVVLGGLERLRDVKAHILGIVINQIDREKADRYYGYGKYSAYGYGKRYSYSSGYSSRRA
ncbi:MAG: polysaccharide biosynthesis tyrosine autokinase [Sulfuritalea sp.]|jgi:capsular exopolysaccharide synthesis family protein|nr:polysaccharide biosynthesis tyrosine autokinase [Sulfuritalea sp.]